MTVLVITQPFDVTADLVIAELNRRNVPVHRIDTADFPTRLAVSARTDGHGQWSGVVEDSYRRTDLAGVTHVYFRRPLPFRLPEMDPLERQWSETEARLGFGGVLFALPHPRWVNHPNAMTAADFKPRQMAVAVRCGMTVPPSVITNDPARAREFVAAHHRSGAIYKPLHARPYIDRDSGRTMALPTTCVSAAEITDAVRGTAHLFQRRMPKAYELRVTVAGAAVLAARIDAHTEAARVDWRTDYDGLTYEPVDLPPAVTTRLLAITRELGLVFAAIDLIVTPEGEYVFLEVNPGGQWAWIEDATGLPITAAIADTLEAQ